MVHPIQGLYLLSALVFLLASRPRTRELRVFLVATVAGVWAHRAWLGSFHFHGVPFGQSVLVALGFGSLSALAFRAATSQRDPEAWGWLHWAVVLPAFGMIMDLSLDLTSALHPRAWDPVVLRLDAGLGQPSFGLGRVIALRPVLSRLFALVYIFLPFAMTAVIAAEKRRTGSRREVLNVILAAAVGGYLLYNLYSVVGPNPLFGDRYPWGPANLPGAARLVDVSHSVDPRNCMPSLHVAWMLLLYWHARWLGPALRAGCALWLAGTIVATLALGHHYLVDLVVAFPFAALIDALVSIGEGIDDAPGRRLSIAVDVGLLLLWYAILFGAPPELERGPTMMLLAVGTVLPTWMFQARWSAAWQVPGGPREGGRGVDGVCRSSLKKAPLTGGTDRR